MATLPRGECSSGTKSILLKAAFGLNMKQLRDGEARMQRKKATNTHKQIWECSRWCVTTEYAINFWTDEEYV